MSYCDRCAMLDAENEKLQAENERLKKELADSLPLQKIRNMVKCCDKNYCLLYDCDKCPHVRLCSCFYDESIQPIEMLDVEKLEQYVKDARNEL